MNVLLILSALLGCDPSVTSPPRPSPAEMWAGPGGHVRSCMMDSVNVYVCDAVLANGDERQLLCKYGSCSEHKVLNLSGDGSAAIQ